MRYRLVKMSTTLVILVGLSAIVAFSRLFQDQELVSAAKVAFIIFLVLLFAAFYTLRNEKDID